MQDDRLEYTNHLCLLCAVPSLAILRIKVYDKDENQYLDDYIGKLKITDVYVGGQREIPIVSLMRKNHGTFRIEVHHYINELPLPAPRAY